MNFAVYHNLRIMLQGLTSSPLGRPRKIGEKGHKRMRSGGSAIGKPAKRITSLPKIGMAAVVGLAWCGRVSGQQPVSGFIKGMKFENLASHFRRS